VRWCSGRSVGWRRCRHSLLIHDESDQLGTWRTASGTLSGGRVQSGERSRTRLELRSARGCAAASSHTLLVEWLEGWHEFKSRAGLARCDR
jgi:hypothetical protein